MKHGSIDPSMKPLSTSFRVAAYNCLSRVVVVSSILSSHLLATLLSSSQEIAAGLTLFQRHWTQAEMQPGQCLYDRRPSKEFQTISAFSLQECSDVTCRALLDFLELICQVNHRPIFSFLLRAIELGPSFKHLCTTFEMSSRNKEWSLVGWPMAKVSLTKSSGVLCT